MIKVATVCTGEIWKDINGYEGLYQVSSLGKIKSLARFTPNQWSETARLSGTNILKCVEHSYNEIKDRKGMFLDGAFIKESDLKP